MSSFFKAALKPICVTAGNFCLRMKRYAKMKKIKEYPETHQTGYLSIEQLLPTGHKMCDFGLQIAKDGRVWICIDGEAYLRFRPTK